MIRRKKKFKGVLMSTLTAILLLGFLGGNSDIQDVNTNDIVNSEVALEQQDDLNQNEGNLSSSKKDEVDEKPKTEEAQGNKNEDKDTDLNKAPETNASNNNSSTAGAVVVEKPQTVGNNTGAGTGGNVSVSVNANSSTNTNTNANTNTNINKTSGSAEVHFINTGNSDAILIKESSGVNVLIDAGDNDDEGAICSYLRKYGISKVDYLVSTHPDADHCGGLDAVINNFNIGTFLVGNGKSTTKTYTSVLTAAANKGVNPSVPLEGKEFRLSSNSYIKFYNTKGGSNSNESSLVALYVKGNDRFLFAGDAGVETENKIISKMIDVDVLKVGHHGSHSSTSQNFINKIKPEIAVITVGKNNKYGHPHKETMSTLQNKNIAVHRTDECGTVILKSSGNGISTGCKKGSYSSGGSSSSTTTSKPATNTNTSTNNTTSGTTSNTSGDKNNSTSNNVNTSTGTSGGASGNTNTNTSTGSTSSSNSSYTGGSNSTSQSQGTVVITQSGTKYHKSTCSTIKVVKDTITKDKAESMGYEACKRCNP